MPESYRSAAEKAADKGFLDVARVALEITPSAMGLDDCSLWVLEGARGRITTWGDGAGYLLHLFTRPSVRNWSGAKKRLQSVGCVLTQDAEDEGVFRFELPLLPNAASEIRELAGLRKAISEEASAALAARARQAFGHR